MKIRSFGIVIAAVLTLGFLGAPVLAEESKIGNVSVMQPLEIRDDGPSKLFQYDGQAKGTYYPGQVIFEARYQVSSLSPVDYGIVPVAYSSGGEHVSVETRTEVNIGTKGTVPGIFGDGNPIPLPKKGWMHLIVQVRVTYDSQPGSLEVGNPKFLVVPMPPPGTVFPCQRQPKETFCP